MAPRPIDIFLDDDLLGLQLPAGPVGDTMVVTQDIGPAVAQLNIPAIGADVNNIAITATKAGHGLLIAKAVFESMNLDALLQMHIRRNGAYIPSTQCSQQIASAVALDYFTLIVAAGLTDIVIGEVFTIRVIDSAGVADLPSDLSSLILVTA